MDTHEQFADDLALYALNALSGEDRQNLEKHLGSCPACRRELEQLRADGALLALSVTGPKPPQRSRQRLLDAIARDTSRDMSRDTSRSPARGPSAVRSSRPGWLSWGFLGWAATAAVLVFALSLWRENNALRQDLLAMNSTVKRQTLDLERARDVVATLTASDAMHVTLVAAKTPPQPQGKAFYVRNRGSLIFLANNMAQLPAQKAYELWLIPVTGAPIPAGVFKPDAHGNASVLNPPLPAGTEAKAFAITIENDAGSATPTTPVMMVGAGE